jgi:hypothetical protein
VERLEVEARRMAHVRRPVDVDVDVESAAADPEAHQNVQAPPSLFTSSENLSIVMNFKKRKK